jgi:hypothetical protein
MPKATTLSVGLDILKENFGCSVQARVPARRPKSPCSMRAPSSSLIPGAARSRFIAAAEHAVFA